MASKWRIVEGPGYVQLYEPDSVHWLCDCNTNDNPRGAKYCWKTGNDTYSLAFVDSMIQLLLVKDCNNVTVLNYICIIRELDE